METIWDKLVLCVFALSACATFLFSSLFHLHICHSREMFIVFGCLDYTGISALIAGSSISITYIFFRCLQTALIGWCSMIVVVNSIGIIGPMFPWWTGPRFRAGRAIIFLSSGAVSAGPLFHYLALYGTAGFPDSKEYFGFLGIVAMMLLYLIGVAVYVGRFPER